MWSCVSGVFLILILSPLLVFSQSEPAETGRCSFEKTWTRVDSLQFLSSPRHFRRVGVSEECEGACRAEASFPCRAFVWGGRGTPCFLHGHPTQPLIILPHSPYYLSEMICLKEKQKKVGRKVCRFVKKQEGVSPPEGGWYVPQTTSIDHCQSICRVNYRRRKACYSYAFNPNTRECHLYGKEMEGREEGVGGGGGVLLFSLHCSKVISEPRTKTPTTSNLLTTGEESLGKKVQHKVEPGQTGQKVCVYSFSVGGTESLTENSEPALRVQNITTQVQCRILCRVQFRNVECNAFVFHSSSGECQLFNLPTTGNNSGGRLSVKCNSNSSDAIYGCLTEGQTRNGNEQITVSTESKGGRRMTLTAGTTINAPSIITNQGNDAESGRSNRDRDLFPDLQAIRSRMESLRERVRQRILTLTSRRDTSRPHFRFSLNTP